MIGVQATGACNPEYALVIPGYSIEESLWSTCKYLHCVFFTIQSIYIIRIVQVNGSGINIQWNSTGLLFFTSLAQGTGVSCRVEVW